MKNLNLVGNGIDPQTATLIIEASLLLDSVPIDLDIESLPPRPRQEIVSSYKASVSTSTSVDDAEDPSISQHTDRSRQPSRTLDDGPEQRK